MASDSMFFRLDVGLFLELLLILDKALSGLMLDLVVYSRDDLLFRLLGGETGDLLECLEMLHLDGLDLLAGVPNTP